MPEKNARQWLEAAMTHTTIRSAMNPKTTSFCAEKKFIIGKRENKKLTGSAIFRWNWLGKGFAETVIFSQTLDYEHYEQHVTALGCL